MPRKKFTKPVQTKVETVAAENTAAMESAASVELPQEMKEELAPKPEEQEVPGELRAEVLEDYKFMFGVPGKMVSVKKGQILSGNDYPLHEMLRVKQPIRIL